MLNGSHMDTHKIYDLTVVHLFSCIFNLRPRAVNMLQSPRYLYPALLTDASTCDINAIEKPPFSELALSYRRTFN